MYVMWCTPKWDFNKLNYFVIKWGLKFQRDVTVMHFVQKNSNKENNEIKQKKLRKQQQSLWKERKRKKL